MEAASFVEMLNQLRQPDDSTRLPAEGAFYNLVHSNPSSAVHMLFDVARTSADSVIPQLALVLLSRMYRESSGANLMTSVNADVHGYVCANLQTCFDNRAFYPQYVALLASSVGDIARVYIRHASLARFVCGLVGLVAERTTERSALLDCIADLIGCFEARELEIDEGQLVGILRRTLVEDLSKPGTIVACVRVLFSALAKGYIGFEQAESALVILNIYNSVRTCAQPEPFLSNFLDDFHSFFHSLYTFFDPHIEIVTRFMLTVVGDSSLTEKSRRIAVDSIAEIAVVNVTVLNACVADVCRVYMRAMAEVDEDSAYNDEVSFSATVGVALGNLAALMNQKGVSLAVRAVVLEFMRDSRWETSYAALFTLRMLVPSCFAVFAPYAEDLVAAVVQHTHEHHIVRRESFGTLAGFLRIKPIAEHYGYVIMTALTNGLASEEVVFVREGIMMAMDIACSVIARDLVAPMVEPIVACVTRLFGRGVPAVDIQVMKILCSLTRTAPDAMGRFYTSWMNMAKVIFASQMSEESIELFCKTMESVVMFESLVPKDVLAPDFARCLEMWLDWSWGELPDNLYGLVVCSIVKGIRTMPEVCFVYVNHIAAKVSDLIVSFARVSDNEYVDPSDLCKVQSTLELTDSVLRLAGPERVLQFTFGNMLVQYLQWNGYDVIQTSALNCIETLWKLKRQSGADVSRVSRLAAFFGTLLSASGCTMSLISRKRFIEVMRTFVNFELDIGNLDVASVIGFMPHILREIWNSRDGGPVYHLEEQLALIMLDIYDKIAADSLSCHVASFVQSLTGITCASAFMFLVSCKHASVYHECPNPAVLVGLTDEIIGDCCEMSRISCNAAVVMIGRVLLEPEFLDRIMNHACICYAKHDEAKDTSEAACRLIARLMQAFPDRYATPVFDV